MMQLFKQLRKTISQNQHFLLEQKVLYILEVMMPYILFLIKVEDLFFTSIYSFSLADNDLISRKQKIHLQKLALVILQNADSCRKLNTKIKSFKRIIHKLRLWNIIWVLQMFQSSCFQQFSINDLIYTYIYIMIEYKFWVLFFALYQDRQ